MSDTEQNEILQEKQSSNPTFTNNNEAQSQIKLLSTTILPSEYNPTSIHYLQEQEETADTDNKYLQCILLDIKVPQSNEKGISRFDYIRRQKIKALAPKRCVSQILQEYTSECIHLEI